MSLASAVDATVRSLDGRIGVACSGGVDSMALADAVLRAVGPARVVIAHVDHQLRPGSAAVARGVAAWARKRGAMAIVRRVVVAPGASLEAAARTARYAALDTVIARHRLAAMLTAHTHDDQAETVLMRLVRGTGVAGLAGIAARHGAYRRPLLTIGRADTQAHVAAQALPTWADAMNNDARFTRVRARKTWLPMLRVENPAVAQALARVAAQAAAWRDVIAALAAPMVLDHELDCVAAAAAPPAVTAFALGELARDAGVELAAPHVTAALALIGKPARGTVTLDVPGGQVVRRYDRLCIAKAAALPATTPPRITGTAGPYEVRRWRAGDRMRPVRLRGRSRTLADLLGDAKIPRADRARTWLAVDRHGEIAWAEHVGAAYGACVRVSSRPPARKSR